MTKAEKYQLLLPQIESLVAGESDMIAKMANVSAALRETTFSMDGTAINCAETPIIIHSGWNWIGYLPLQTMSVADALADIEPVAGDLIKSKKAFAVYDGTQWFGTLNRMTPGEGYMYLSKATEPFTFRYPGMLVDSKLAARRLLSAVKSQLSTFVPVSDPYSGNMSIVARVLNGTEPVHGVEVGIFAGDECRGEAVEEEGNYWFITVAGDEPTPLTIRIYDPATGQITLVNQALEYTDDASLGTLAEPYIINLQKTDGIEQSTADGQQPTKLLENGILYILRNGEKFDATGKKVE